MNFTTAQLLELLHTRVGRSAPPAIAACPHGDDVICVQCWIATLRPTQVVELTVALLGWLANGRPLDQSVILAAIAELEIAQQAGTLG